jgi:hypothetical protein
MASLTQRIKEIKHQQKTNPSMTPENVFIRNLTGMLVSMHQIGLVDLRVVVHQSGNIHGWCMERPVYKNASPAKQRQLFSYAYTNAQLRLNEMEKE